MPVPDVCERSIADLISLKGRNAVVTGGARGIGLAICSRLAEAGANVMIGDFNLAAAQASAAQIVEQGWKATSGKLDATNSASLRDFADTVARELGSIDIWVNNAGIYPYTEVWDITDDEWDQVLDINLRGAFIGSREAARHMMQRKQGGVIINMASTAAFAAGSGRYAHAHYVASKHGLVGLTKSLAVELGRFNIRVLALAPTLIATPGTQETRAEDLQNPAIADYWPLGRVGLPDDVARVALFCASDLSMFMTGSTLMIDAGLGAT